MEPVVGSKTWRKKGNLEKGMELGKGIKPGEE